jgi:hypothetical protein
MEENEYNGTTRLQVKVIDVRKTPEPLKGNH